MSRFFCICNSNHTDSLDLNERLDSLKEACNFHSIEFVLLDESCVDFSTLPTPTSADGLYNCARGSYITERSMLNRNVRTFYRNYEVLSQKDDSNILSIELKKHNISIPKTIYKGTNDRNLLNKYVNFLEGFPLIIKTYGGVSGVGVIRVESYSSLFSITDFLVKNHEDFQIKQFIKSNSCERVTVLGDKVLYSITKPIKKQEFRSDGYSKSAKKVELGNRINDIAIKAAHASNLNFAGIDIIVDINDNEAYVLEVNLPHNFVRHEKITGEKYSRDIIGWMFKK